MIAGIVVVLGIIGYFIFQLQAIKSSLPERVNEGKGTSSENQNGNVYQESGDRYYEIHEEVPDVESCDKVDYVECETDESTYLNMKPLTQTQETLPKVLETDV